MKKTHIRSIIFSLVIILLSGLNFYRSGETESIKAIQIVSLLVCGMAIGVFLMNFFGWLRSRKN